MICKAVKLQETSANTQNRAIRNLSVSAVTLEQPAPCHLIWNGAYHTATFSISDKSSERHMNSGICRSDENFHKKI